MGWPMRLRALSFAITFAILMMECAVVAVPLGLGLWYFAAAAPRSMIAWMVPASIAISLVISGQAHVRAQRYSAEPRRRIA